MSFEFIFLDWLQTLHTPVMDKVMVLVTSLGSAGILWIALALALLIARRTRPTGICMLIAMALGFLTGNLILKPLIHRARPCWVNETVHLLVAVPQDYSFPSGHALASFAAAVSIRQYNRKWGVAAIVLAALIAFSRLYLYVHFPTDVLAGILLGICAALTARLIMRKIYRRDVTDSV